MDGRMKYLSNLRAKLRERKLKFYSYAIKRYIHHRNYFNKGWGEINSIRQLAQIDTIFAGVLKIFGVSNKTTAVILIILTISTVLICWWIGKWWDKNNAYYYENQWSNERNELYKKVERLSKD